MAAGDNTAQRQNVASKAVVAATQLVDALNTLLALSDQRSKFVSPFVDADFAGTANTQLTAGMMGTLFDFVVPSLNTNYLDAANGNRNKQILLQVRNG
jgi:hypothetical protein